MHPGILRVLSARRSLSLFLAVVACLAIWQVWLTWRLMEQDRNLELQRSRQRLEQTADLALSQLERRIGDWDLALRELKSLPPSTAVLSKVPAGATFILVSHGSVLLYPKRPLLFVPEVPARGESQAHAFDAADELELQEQEYDRAIAALQPLLNRSATRAEALVRIARIERKANRPQAALDAYKRLESEKGVNLSGTPYAVLAANARCQIFTQLGKWENAAHEARSLRDALLEGHWPILHETFNYYWAELGSFGIDVGQPPETSLRTSMLVSELYNRWHSAVRADSTTSGRDPTPGSRFVVNTRRWWWDSSLLVWNAAPDRLAAMVTPPDWLGPSLGLPADIHWKMVLPGERAQNALSVTRSLADAQLPGLIEFFNVP